MRPPLGLGPSEGGVKCGWTTAGGRENVGNRKLVVRYGNGPVFRAESEVFVAKQQGKTRRGRPPRKGVPGAVVSVRRLGEHLGQPFTTVSGWVRHPDWPFRRKAPWPADLRERMLTWAATTLERSKVEDPEAPLTGKARERRRALQREKLWQEVRRLVAGVRGRRAAVKC